MKKAFLLLCTLLLVLGCALPLAAYHLTRAVLGPAVSTVRLPLSSPESTASAPEISAAYAGDADRFLIQDASTGQVLELSRREYLIGAVAAEMPVSWPDEALKAQAVAAHSYALSLGGAAFSCNSAQCAGWTTAEVLRARWDGEFSTYYSRLAALADEAAGAVLCWERSPAAACYHSISAGQTEASQNVWLTAVPYLQGVSSPWDADAPGFETAVTYSAEQVYSVLLALGLDADEIPNAPADWFGGGVSDAAGYVAQMPLCGQVFTGTKLRNAFSLRSAAFTVAYDPGENAFVFTTHGYGHGVGLSQYGAKAMAEDGKDWREILEWYFPGCEVME